MEDVDDILAIEKSSAGIKTYSALTKREEVIKEIINSVFYLIEKDGESVGDTSYELRGRDVAYISGLVVLPQFQGQGIARQSMEIILEELRDVKLVELVTHPKNEKAINLYASFGFKKRGAEKENYFGDGEPRIKMILEK